MEQGQSLKWISSYVHFETLLINFTTKAVNNHKLDEYTTIIVEEVKYFLFSVKTTSYIQERKQGISM